MRAYECLYIVHPGADTNELDGSAKKYGEIIESKGGAVRKADIWGKRQLAYPIKNMPDGNFVLLRFDAPAEAIADLEFRMRVDDRVLRYMTSMEVPEGAGQSDELMQLTERKERDRRGRGRGRGRGGRFGDRGGRPGGDYQRGPRDGDSRPGDRPAAAPAERPSGDAPAPPAADDAAKAEAKSDGGSD